MFNLFAFHEVIDPAGVLSAITAVNDDLVFTVGEDLRVPSQSPFLLGATAALEATSALQAQLQSPSLRRIAYYDITPFDTGLVIDNGHKMMMHPQHPYALNTDESLNFMINTNPAGATSQYGLVWMGDGSQAPVAGEMFTVRCTSLMTAVLGEWTSGNIVFGQDLPVGEYDIVGMRVIEPTTVAARLIFKGGVYRPGCNALGDETAIDRDVFRHGGMGIWGTFHTNTPPSIEVISAAGGIVPIIYLDLMAR